MWALLLTLLGLLQIDGAPIVEDPVESMPPDPFMESTDVPKPDTPYTYTGPGTQPSWSDVYAQAEKDFVTEYAKTGWDTTNANIIEAMYAGKVAIAQSLKAMSGFINRTYSDAIHQLNLLSDITDYEFGDIVGRINNIIRVVNQIAAELTGLTGYVLPLIRAEFDKIEHDYPIAIQYGIELERQWTLNNVFAPLYAEILKVQPAIDASAAHTTQVAHDDTAVQVAALAASVGTVVTGIRTALSALQTENENCTKPMCETMGPGTALGNLLKGLEAALEAGALLEIANLTESDVAQMVNAVASQAKTYIDFFESTFVQGGDTIGQTVEAAISKLI